MDIVIGAPPYMLSFWWSPDDLSPGKQNLQPIPRPEQALTDSLSLLSSEDWWVPVSINCFSYTSDLRIQSIVVFENCQIQCLVVFLSPVFTESQGEEDRGSGTCTPPGAVPY